jgi:glycosyltransferase involved in cell wall biosynthesis
MIRPLLVSNFDHVIGGGEVGLVDLYGWLVARGHRPRVAVPGSGPLAAGLDRVRVRPHLDSAGSGLAAAASDCDLVHTYSVGMASAVLAVGTSKPIILHALIPNASPLDAGVGRRVDAIVCNSRATARRFESVGSTLVVYNGVPEPSPPSGSLVTDSTRKTIAVVGNTTMRKGQLDVLPALEEVLRRRSDVDVRFIGRIVPPVSRRLRQLCHPWGDRMTLIGFVPDVRNHLSEFSLVLVPSRSEGWGRAAVEALRAGTPVLATPVEGLLEALSGHANPWLPAERRLWPGRILQELDHPAHTPEELVTIGRRYSPDHYVERILAVYERVLNRPGRGDLGGEGG